MAFKKFTDEYFMKCCLNLAKQSLGETYPNPIVGAIIVYKDKIIGKGWRSEEHTSELQSHS